MSTNSEKQVEVKERPARVLILIGIAFGIFVFGFAAYLVFLLFTAPAPNIEDNKQTNAETSQLDDALVPEARDITIVQEDSSQPLATVKAVVDKVDSGYYSEWRVIDDEGNTLVKGITPTDGVISKKLRVENGLNSFVFQVRVSDGISSTQWDSSPVIELEVSDLPVDPNANQNPGGGGGYSDAREPFKEYFDTAWAKGSGGISNLEEATEAAWGATKVDYWADECMYLNREVLSPGEMVPPVPGTVPAGLLLKYEVINDNSGLELQFYWCTDQ
jgi:hypothetical protein